MNWGPNWRLEKKLLKNLNFITYELYFKTSSSYEYYCQLRLQPIPIPHHLRKSLPNFSFENSPAWPRVKMYPLVMFYKLLFVKLFRKKVEMAEIILRFMHWIYWVKFHRPFSRIPVESPLRIFLLFPVRKTWRRFHQGCKYQQISNNQ